MTPKEYRQHMRTYSRDTMTSSFVVTKHPDYQALKTAGEEIIPYLLVDMLDPDWHCTACYGEGYEFVSTWREEWDKNKTYPYRGTGFPCPECKGKGDVCSWACMALLWEIIGRNSGKGPVIKDWMRGKHEVLVGQWRKWAGERGYMPPIPGVSSRLTKIWRGIVGVFKSLA